MSVEIKTRKTRVSKQQVLDFVKYYLTNIDELKQYSDGQLSVIYLNKTNVFIPQQTVKNNRHAWVLYNNELVRTKVYDLIKAQELPTSESTSESEPESE